MSAVAGSVSGAAILVCLGALALIGALPRVFFRRGRLNARWWVTAAPFILAGLALPAGLVGLLDPLTAAATTELLVLPAIGAAVSGAALIGWTLRTHARPVSLWHQADDRPNDLVTHGAYGRVRHPFYAAFLLILLGCALALPHVLTLLAFGAAYVLLDRTAAREEQRLLDQFEAPYAAYMRRTGRFLPRLIDAAAAPGAALHP